MWFSKLNASFVWKTFLIWKTGYLTRSIMFVFSSYRRYKNCLWKMALWSFSRHVLFWYVCKYWIKDFQERFHEKQAYVINFNTQLIFCTFGENVDIFMYTRINIAIKYLFFLLVPYRGWWILGKHFIPFERGLFCIQYTFSCSYCMSRK